MKGKELRVGLIGHKFMGKAHSNAYRKIPMFFQPESRICLDTLCGIGEDLEETARRYGFSRFCTDWRRVVEDPKIDIVDICTPDNFHREIAVAAAGAGKHVVCEKPLALSYAEAREMTGAVTRAGVKNLCNFTYRGVPALMLARKIIKDGGIGRVLQLDMRYLQDFALSPDTPFGWRMDTVQAGPGIAGDKGAHVIDLARFLADEPVEVCGCSSLYVHERPVSGTSERKEVTTPDAVFFLINFHKGAKGVFTVSNASAGRKNALLLEIYGDRGAIRFDLERINELEVYIEKKEDALNGFRTVNVTESFHPMMYAWWPSGHVLGWEHAFVHQLYGFIRAIETDGRNESAFEDGMLAQRVIDAVGKSIVENRWIRVDTIH
ncbi:MAG: Gfo/Idh/MocA family oxidoreductase [Treponema sp.]|nr:Gfo/Idh/MocA family oxidoreductase [Treponema sp.]